MNVMNQMMDQLTAQVVNQLGTKTQQSASSKDGSDFQSLVKKYAQSDNKQTANNASDKKDTTATTAKPAGDNNANNANGAAEEPSDELRAIAAALGMQMPVTFVDVQSVQQEPMVQTAQLTEVVQSVQEEVMPEMQTADAVQAVEVQPMETPVQAVEQPQQVQSQTTADTETNPGDLSQNTTQQQDDQPVENVVSYQNQPVFHDVETTPVKVGETYDPVPLESEEGVQTLAEQLTDAVAQGESKVEITLTPANLGKLTVEITRTNDGTMNVVLHATTEKASNLLQQHSGSLQNLLAGSNQSEVRVEVRGNENAQQQFLNPDDSNQREHQQQQHKQHKQQEQQSQDFIQQLRLGLVQIEPASV